jgi:hypothetical protein
MHTTRASGARFLALCTQPVAEGDQQVRLAHRAQAHMCWHRQYYTLCSPTHMCHMQPLAGCMQPSSSSILVVCTPQANNQGKCTLRRCQTLAAAGPKFTTGRWLTHCQHNSRQLDTYKQPPSYSSMPTRCCTAAAGCTGSGRALQCCVWKAAAHTPKGTTNHCSRAHAHFGTRCCVQEPACTHHSQLPKQAVAASVTCWPQTCAAACWLQHATPY